VTAINVGQMIVGMLIGWRSLCVLNTMTRSSYHTLRVLHLLTATFAAGVVLAPLYNDGHSEVFQLATLAALLALYLTDRRRAR
jgi:hypothetical protein